MNIEQRSIEWAKSVSPWITSYDQFSANVYALGATEQQKIDIDNGKKFCKKWLDELIASHIPELKNEPYYSKTLEIMLGKFEQTLRCS